MCSLTRWLIVALMRTPLQGPPGSGSGRELSAPAVLGWRGPSTQAGAVLRPFRAGREERRAFWGACIDGPGRGMDARVSG
jgi:hypothetical protein